MSEHGAELDAERVLALFQELSDRLESEALLVQVASPEYLLAMKLYASRDDRDLDDAATLFLRLGYTTAEQGIELLTSTYPAARLLPRHRYIVEDVAQRAAETRG